MKNKIKLPEGWELKRLEDGLYEVIQKTESLEIGKDYIHIHASYLVINRIGDEGNLGFTRNGELFDTELYCSNPKDWIEATKEDVREFFAKHLIERYGEDWEDVKMNECMYQDDEYTNEGLNSVDIDKYSDSWMVWNKNGCLFNGKEWAEEKKVATDLSDIDRPYYISPLGKITCTYSGTLQTKNHMTSRELCEGILALQQLIAFRDNFYEVHGRNFYNTEGAICLVNEGDGSSCFKALYVHSDMNDVDIFEFDTHDQAKMFLETHKELFNELKKLY